MILFVKNRGGILSYLIIDKRMRNIEKQKLKDLGYNLIEIKENKNKNDIRIVKLDELFKKIFKI